MRDINRLFLVAAVFLLVAATAECQATARQLKPILEASIHPADITAFQLRQYALKKVPRLVVPASAARWTEESARLRKRVLDEAVFRGWPAEWRDGALKFEDLGYMPSGRGYRMRKLRYEIVPGMQTTAILYEPEKIQGKVPAVLNVNGHEPAGKSVEYKQKRCINQALHGILALSPEWFYMGELRQPDNTHWFLAHLDVNGMSGLGLMYLAMRKGLDYLWQHPNVDRDRIAVTGLSGGGWQTIVLSSLDERVKVAIPVAGYSTANLVGGNENIGDNENSPTDMLSIADYTHLTAMRAPRPTLLVYNAEDNCCFRSPLVKPFLLDGIKPFFALYGAAASLDWHENLDPGDHNYQLENRVEAYRFLAKHFDLKPIEREIPVDGEIKSLEELSVGLPKNNLTILGLARKIATQICREPIPTEEPARQAWRTAERQKLEQLVRLPATKVNYAWILSNMKSRGLESHSYRFDFSNGLSATGVCFRALSAPEPKTATIVLSDEGKKESADAVAERINRGERVLALDLIFTGDAAPPKFYYPVYDRILASLGERSLSIRTAQLLGIVGWLRGQYPDLSSIRLDITGMRSQITALTAAALQAGMFKEIQIQKGLESLSAVFDLPVRYEEAPELFCWGFYKNLDFRRLEMISAPTLFTHRDVPKQ